MVLGDGSTGRATGVATASKQERGNMAHFIRIFLCIAVSATPVASCNAPEPNEAKVQVSPLTSPLTAHSYDAALSDETRSMPHISVENGSDEEWRGFTYYYYFTAEEDKTPVMEPTAHSGDESDVVIEQIDGDLWRVKYDCRDCTVGAHETYPNLTGVGVELRYEDDSPWDKSDDPSFLAATALSQNENIPVFDNNYHPVGGTDYEDWPSFEEPEVCEENPFAPLPRSMRFRLPAPVGSHYTVENVPDTLDLAKMAADSLGGMLHVVDYEECSGDLDDNSYRLFFQTDWNHNPPVLVHEEKSDDGLGKFLGPITLSRLVSGVAGDDDAQIERRILSRYLQDYSNVIGAQGTGARAFEGFTYRYFRDHNPIWKTLVLQAAQDMVEALVVPDDADFGYWESDADPNHADAQDPWREEVLLMAYKQFGFAPALGAVGKHIRWARYESGIFSDDGAFQGTHDRGDAHFHISALYWLPFLEYGLLVKDQELIDWVNRSYEWAKGSESGAVSEIGYFPELVHHQENGETCPITDMIIAGMRLSLAGVEDHWDDVDNWVRNHFAESQLTPDKAECMENWSHAEYPEVDTDYEKPDEDEPHPDYSYKQATARSMGGFAGWQTYNSWKHRDSAGIQQCCTGNGSRTVSLVWQNIATANDNGNDDGNDDELKVNLLLNRADPDFDVFSYLPYEGKVRVAAKRDFNKVWIRIPGGFTSGIAVKIVDGGNRSANRWEGRYLNVGALAAGRTVEVTFPNPTNTTDVTVNDETLTVSKRGSTVVALDPPGEGCGLYQQRDVMWAETAPMIETQTRWASSEPNLLDQTDRTWRLPATFIESPDADSGWYEEDGEREWVDFTGENLLDGDQSLKSRWSATGEGKYALFDLGRPFRVAYINVASAESDEGEPVSRKLEVQFSLDGDDFSRACVRRTSGVTANLEALTCKGKARYVKLIGLDDEIDFTELEIWGSVAARPKVLSISEITASDDEDKVDRVVDRKLKTYWDGGGTDVWIQFDLGERKTVAAVKMAVYKGAERVQYFDIYVSDDPEEDDWTLLYRNESSGETRRLKTVDVPNIAARYVRIVGRGSSKDDDLSLSEVRILGY